MHETTGCRPRRQRASGSGPVKTTEGPSDTIEFAPTTMADIAQKSSFEQVFGFGMEDLASWPSVVRLFDRPVDGSSLALFRMLFGIAMMMDIPHERGLSFADSRWADVNECRFPLFNWLRPLPVQWMYAVYWAMLTGATGIVLGVFFRVSCLLFVIPYWYIFLLDKTVWNNHSYLYGLIGLFLLVSDAQRSWSVDSLRPRPGVNTVPLWNYIIIRTQIFIVYFVAGVKKLESDWLNGHSVPDLSRHWIFSPFRFMLTSEQIDLWIVHRCGFLMDLLIGFALFFDFTRPLGAALVSLFHCMNSFLFPIGMFPYVMLTTTPLFCCFDWPRVLARRVRHRSSCLHLLIMRRPSTGHGSYCVDTPTSRQSNGSTVSRCKENQRRSEKTNLRQQVAVVGTVTFVVVQFFLPFSHFLTPGYNNWTNGLYGYSWDMMVHNWDVQHVRIKYVDQSTGSNGYLRPNMWSNNVNRWGLHADTVKQYATCVADRLATNHSLKNVSLYFDVWCSLNGRFQQSRLEAVLHINEVFQACYPLGAYIVSRPNDTAIPTEMWDPRVDLVRADWSPFRRVTWSLPLLVSLSDWRTRLDDIVAKVVDSSNDTDIIFVADFPGMKFDSYIQDDLTDTNVLVLKGDISILMESGSVANLTEGDTIQIPAGQFIEVITVSEGPSCYQYTYINSTARQARRNLTIVEEALARHRDADNATDAALSELSDPNLIHVWQEAISRRSEDEFQSSLTVRQRVEQFFANKLRQFLRAYRMSAVALDSITSGRSFEDVLHEIQISLEPGNTARQIVD